MVWYGINFKVLLLFSIVVSDSYIHVSVKPDKKDLSFDLK